MSAQQGNWWIVCDEREVGPITDEATALRRMEAILTLDACHCHHKVEYRQVPA